MTAIEQYAKEHEEEINTHWRKMYPPASEARSREIMEASKHVELDEYNPKSEWCFQDGESPFGWYEAQVNAINHFGHIFCINPFYDNFNKYTWDGRLKSNDDQKFYGFEFDSTEELLNYLNQSNKTNAYLDMTVRTIQYLKNNPSLGLEFPMQWDEQFSKQLLPS